MSTVIINKPWDDIYHQSTSDDDGNVWKTTDLIMKSKDLPIKEMPIEFINLDFKIGKMAVRDFVAHMKLIMDVDLTKPIILDQDASLFDGRHRVAKALLNDIESIKCVRFLKDPSPTYIKEVVEK